MKVKFTKILKILNLSELVNKYEEEKIEKKIGDRVHKVIWRSKKQRVGNR